MTNIVGMILTALAAVTVENIIFSGGIGFSRVLRAARKPKTLGMYSAFITVFSVISSVMGYYLNRLFPESKLSPILRPAALAVCIALVYILAAGILKLSVPAFYKKYGQILSPAAINTVVLSMPYVIGNYRLGLWDAVGFALGTGVSFFFATIILSRALHQCKNEDMPNAFSGLPATLIYIGILSMAFAGFTGGKIF